MNTNNIILLLLNKTSYQLRTKQKNQFYIYEALIRAASSSKQQKNERLYSSTVWCLDRLIIYPGQRTLLRQHENMLLSSTRRLYPLNFLSSSNSSSNLSSKSQPPDEQSISDHDKTISNNTTIDEPNSVVVVDDEESLKIDRSIYTEQITVRMPDINEGINKVIKWYKKEGDIIKYEDVLCDIETPGMYYFFCFVLKIAFPYIFIDWS